VHRLILITQHPSNPPSNDAKMLVDIDLSILGADKVIFAEYERNIRKEYSWVEASIYCIERRKVLRSFLTQQQIYQTDYFYTRREQQARDNIENLTG
jgi:predicted metal-dependent HD superfamily phosphohydrolase